MENEHRPCALTNDEVTLPMAALGSAVDSLGPFVSEAIRRAKAFEEFDIAWFEEPMPAEDIDGHVRLSQSTSLPIAVGKSLYHPSHFREYLQRRGCSIVQVDVARIGGVTPWLKTAHLARNVQHASLSALSDGNSYRAVRCGSEFPWVEFIPQLDVVTKIADRR